MIFWKPFLHAGVRYDLSHLHPTTITYLQPAQEGKPERAYKVDVIFSLHCFTRGQLQDEKRDKHLCYSDNRETRIFDFERYGLSKGLLSVVKELMNRPCYQTGKDNFVVIDRIDSQERIISYEIYFDVFLAARKVLTLRIISAYPRDEEKFGNRPKTKTRIHFGTILNNRLLKKPIVFKK